ncbi:aspartate-semialdehyde dehydrogenase [Hazenella sp. IB182357]|uniref:Aspartate-semialdehyde dehydrogenase n=1 Tax=Polycladospora coralii TaxID=2771432 RepID=A0A926RYG3_9BACL|nr:aspartate-semialdehyde dehydrogenase [Polycladospora coralii]MBD1373486.1 aspartate-semialdehyde dehydrogenase [Polycladospora coralii]
MDVGYRVAVVGATGAVGQQMLKFLEEREFPVREIIPLSSARSAGNQITFMGKQVEIQEAKPESFTGVDIALFSAGGNISKQLAPEAVKRGAVVIDNTSAYRMDTNVPLVVPEVNPDAIRRHNGIIANPNCSTIQMVAALKPLVDKYGLERIIVSTYQAVSGAGMEAMQELEAQSEAWVRGDDVQAQYLPVGKAEKHYQMAFNVIPQVDMGQENNFTFEEMKMIQETKKILEDESIRVAATCVRVPVMRGHSESVYVELKSDYDLAEVRSLLHQTDGIIVQDNIIEQEYPMPLDATDRTEVFVGRLRRDLDYPRGLHLWVVSDNLLKGAATNSIQIAETLVSQGL